MASTTDRTYRFGRFELNPGTRQLLVDGRPAVLGARALDVLHALVERRDRLVTKGELLDVVWPGVIVEENNLAAHVSALRKVLGAHAIATVPGRGYRFVAALETTQNAGVRDGTKLDGAHAEGSARLIGRDHDKALIESMLADERLVTIVGPGGIGKTRLARSIASSRAECSWVELAPINDPALIPDAILAALGMGVNDSAGGIDALVNATMRKRITIVLDNGEHLIEPLARLVTLLLERTSAARFLVTSRELLKVTSEAAYRLEGLGIPGIGASVREAQSFGAVELFLTRATAVDHRYRVSDEQLPLVVDICRKLDGMPLAIEFAAARAPVLGAARLSEQIDRRLESLGSATRNGPARQQTLQATLDWSHELLAEPERRYFRRLAVFWAGFTLDAAREVAADDPADEWASSEILASLVDKSMVAMDGADVPRYSLLETTRVYALQQLARSGEEREIRRRHALHFVRLFEAFHEIWLIGPEHRWHPSATAEMDNLYAALDWSFGPGGDPTVGTRLAAAGIPIRYVIDRRQRHRILEWLDLAITHVDPSADARAAARLWLGRSYFIGFVDAAAARDAGRRATVYFREAHDEIGLVHALVESSRAAGWAGDFIAAEHLLQEALSTRTSGRAPALDGLLELTFGFVLSNAGSPSQAADAYRRAAGILDQCGSDSLRQLARTGLADSLWAAQDLEAAETGFRESLRHLREAGHVRSYLLAVTLGNLAGVLIERGATDEALALAREAIPIFLDSGRTWSVISGQALRLALVGRHEAAARLIGHCASSMAAAKRASESNERRLRERTLELLRLKLESGALDRLMREGSLLSDEEACRLALET